MVHWSNFLTTRFSYYAWNQFVKKIFSHSIAILEEMSFWFYFLYDYFYILAKDRFILAQNLLKNYHKTWGYMYLFDFLFAMSFGKGPHLNLVVDIPNDKKWQDLFLCVYPTMISRIRRRTLHCTPMWTLSDAPNSILLHLLCLNNSFGGLRWWDTCFF